jgi:hypothetical protein
MLGPIQRRSGKHLNQVRERMAKFANNINESGRENLAEHRLTA